MLHCSAAAQGSTGTSKGSNAAVSDSIGSIWFEIYVKQCHFPSKMLKYAIFVSNCEHNILDYTLGEFLVGIFTLGKDIDILMRPGPMQMF